MPPQTAMSTRIGTLSPGVASHSMAVLWPNQRMTVLASPKSFGSKIHFQISMIAIVDVTDGRKKIVRMTRCDQLDPRKASARPSESRVPSTTVAATYVPVLDSAWRNRSSSANSRRKFSRPVSLGGLTPSKSVKLRYSELASGQIRKPANSPANGSNITYETALRRSQVLVRRIRPTETVATAAPPFMSLGAEGWGGARTGSPRSQGWDPARAALVRRRWSP